MSLYHYGQISGEFWCANDCNLKNPRSFVFNHIRTKLKVKPFSIDSASAIIDNGTKSAVDFEGCDGVPVSSCKNLIWFGNKENDSPLFCYDGVEEAVKSDSPLFSGDLSTPSLLVTDKLTIKGYEIKYIK